MVENMKINSYAGHSRVFSLLVVLMASFPIVYSLEFYAWWSTSCALCFIII